MNKRASYTILTLVMLSFSALFAQPRSGSSDSGAIVEYPFHPGDALRIAVYPDTLVVPNGVYHINDNGDIQLPIAGTTHVASMSAGNLADFVKHEYIGFLKVPNATIRPLIRVSVVGGFHSPGLFYIDPDQSLWDAVRLAGGPVRDDGLGKIRWMRKDSTIASSIMPYLKSGSSLKNIGFVSGDQLVVTSRPQHTAGEIITGTVLPVLSFVVTAALTGLTVYQFYK